MARRFHVARWRGASIKTDNIEWHFVDNNHTNNNNFTMHHRLVFYELYYNIEIPQHIYGAFANIVSLSLPIDLHTQ